MSPRVISRGATNEIAAYDENQFPDYFVKPNLGHFSLKEQKLNHESMAKNSNRIDSSLGLPKHSMNKKTTEIDKRRKAVQMLEQKIMIDETKKKAQIEWERLITKRNIAAFTIQQAFRSYLSRRGIVQN